MTKEVTPLYERVHCVCSNRNELCSVGSVQSAVAHSGFGFLPIRKFSASWRGSGLISLVTSTTWLLLPENSVFFLHKHIFTFVKIIYTYIQVFNVLYRNLGVDM